MTIPVFLTILFFTILCLATLIIVAKNKLWLVVYIPLTLFTIGSMVYTYNELLGHPTSKQLPKDFLVVSYIIKEPKFIFLWLIEETDNQELQEPVSYVIPYSRDVHESIDGVKKELREKNITGIIKGKLSNDNQMVIFEAYDFTKQEFMKKD